MADTQATTQWEQLSHAAHWPLEGFRAHASACYAHDWRWGTFCERTYGWQPHRFVADGALLQLAQAPWPQKAILSMPYVTHSGILGNAPPSSLGPLCKMLKVSHLDLRQLDFETQNTEECTFLLELPRTSEQLWEQFKAKLRSQIRKPIKENLTTSNDLKHLEAFYRIYGRRMHSVGSPWHGRPFFLRLLETFEDCARLITVQGPNGTILGGAILFTWHGKAAVPLAAVDASANKLAPNMLLYWECLRQAIDTSCTVFDFGRSQRNSGTYRFKMQWEPTCIGVQTLRVDAEGQVQTRRLGYRTPSAQRLSTLWSRLPYPLLAPLGSRLRRWIP